ncbi:hypothetical protein F3Y22_tig00117012pilonHSYRG00121 [Hibiscus syriacus]|uniref:RNase H type-1 domain-containing protein n=1 Tax=Hibiscus syriacus TaxID=106335 RepID=A0A6A2XQ07_HIBSY|nr:hypothetical protein F3Y22_tig00117012pilonHSYRG00121 [Hibiscus syriacus]
MAGLERPFNHECLTCFLGFELLAGVHYVWFLDGGFKSYLAGISGNFLISPRTLKNGLLALSRLFGGFGLLGVIGSLSRVLLLKVMLLSGLVLVTWEAPKNGNFKLNTDGACKGNPGISGAGGILRDERSNWMFGFFTHLRTCSSVAAELYVIRIGLSVAWDHGFRAIECEVDARVALNLIEFGNISLHPFGSIIADIRSFRDRTWGVHFSSQPS